MKQSNMRKRTKQLIQKQIEKKILLLKNEKLLKKKTKIDNIEKKMKINKFETKHIYTTDKKKYKKKFETVKIETFVIVNHY